MKRAFHPSALLLCVLAAVFVGGCAGEEKTYTDHLVRGARAAEGQETRQNLELIGSALERYAIDHGGYPEASSVQEIEDLVTPTPTPMPTSTQNVPPPPPENTPPP